MIYRWKTIYVDYPQPIRAVDYSYYPYSYRSYRPLTLYYNYYWPLSSLNRYSDSWPYYPYYRYLYYKYTLPSDRYYHLKGNMLSVDEPIREYRVHPRAEYLRRKVYKPLSLYCDYYYPIRGLFNSPYWPMYRNLSDFAEFCRDGSGTRLQRIFDDETRLIRAQTASLLRRVHDPVPRVQRYSWPLAITSTPYQKTLSARLGNDNYIHRLLMTSPKNPRVEFTTYYSEPVRKYIGGGHLSCISYAGERAHNRRPYMYLYEDPVRSDIQLLSYYINKFKQDKAIAAPPTADKAALNPNRPTRKFTAQKPENDAETDKEMRKLREARAARLAFIETEGKSERASADVEDAVRAKRAKEAERLAEEQALAEEQSRKQALAKKEEAARRAELARQEELAAQAAAEKAAEIDRQAELARQEELAKQAEIEKARQQEEERQRLEEQRRLDEETRAAEERKQLLRLEEIARQAEEEKEAELARQADELAELARQEAELAEQARVQAEADEQSRIEAEAAEQSRLEAELAELVRKEQELSEQAIQEAEAAEKAREEAEAAKSAAEEELEELERQQAELDALEAEAKALEAESAPVEGGSDTEEQPLAQEDQPVIEEEDPVVEEPEELVVEDEEPVADEEEDEDARRQREMDELVQQRFEQAQMEGLATGNDDDDDEEPAIAEDTPEQSDTEE